MLGGRRAHPVQEFGSVAAETLFGVHGAALEVRSRRMGLLASNIANASTPGFKAQDVDFRSTLSAVEQSGDAASTDAFQAAVKYRVPNQTSMDANTVDLNQEQTAFAENAVQYQTTLSFLNGRIGQITRALKGE
nr:MULTISPECIES: flagellar basal body rod protein FlgB [unclassified Sphingomonas]